jgi:AcrR family transcriptional regulator
MPSPSARTGRSERLNALRRQLILDAAQRVFERDGLEKTTIRAIAAEAGCTTGAIYPWFAGKETIYGTSVLRGSRLDHRVDRPDVEGRTNDCRS